MAFEIKNPNYCQESLEKVTAAVISRHDSTEPIATFENEKQYILSQKSMPIPQKSAEHQR